MIHKVDGNSYYDYTKPKKVDIPDTGEKFSLGYQKDGVSQELKDKKEKEVSDQEKQQAAERNGVRIELSSRGVEKQKQAEAMNPKANASGQTPLLETIRTFLTTAITAIKDIFSKIWNDPQPGIVVQEIAEGTEPADTAEDTDVMGVAEGTEAANAMGVVEGTEAAVAMGVIEGTEAAAAMGVIEGTEAAAAMGVVEGTEATAAMGDAEGIEATAAMGVVEGAASSVMGGARGEAGKSTRLTGLIGAAEMIETTDFTDAMEDASAAYTDEERREHEIRQHLQKGDMNQVIRLLTDNGRKTVARNSTLLTCYDKNGKVVELDASVRQRTLYGDRNTRKL